MQAPANPDDKIKELLLNQDSAKQIAGLELLDETYRLETIGYIRKWNMNSLLTLHSDDLADIWEATLSSVAKNVEDGKFKSKGNLRAYLRTIARRRAADLLRKILRIRTTDKLDDVPVWSAVEKDEIIELINKAVRMLSKKLRIVAETDVILFFEKFKWPTLQELTDELNRLPLNKKIPMKESTVKGRRSRGRKKLRVLIGPDILDGEF